MARTNEAAEAADATGVPARPDLLVIMSDQHSPHVLGGAGDPIVRTPNLDRLAARGVRFPTAYCPAPLCVPSRMAFLTGQMPSAIRVWTNACVLGSDVPTFAHALAAGATPASGYPAGSGYETMLCGRMHFQGPDQRHGFERRMVGDVIGGVIGGKGPNFGHVPASTAGQTAVAHEYAGPGRTSYQAYDAAVTRQAITFLRERAARPRAGRRPFCLVVGYVLPHSPYICPRPLFDYYYDRVVLPQIPDGYLDRLHPAMRLWRERRGVGRITPEQARRARAAYFGLVTVLDENVGQILSALDETGLATHTATVYTSDHGEMAGEHGLWWKCSAYDGSAGIPLIWSFPGHFPAGVESPAFASLIDVGPTLLDLAGAAALPNASGRSLLPWLRGGPPVGRPQQVEAEIIPGLGSPPARLIRRGPWKLTYFAGYDTPQLFNLDQDPNELDDRATDPSCATICAELLAAARTGWSPGDIEATLDRRTADRRLLTAYARATNLPDHDPDYWSVPPDYNIFPDS